MGGGGVATQPVPNSRLFCVCCCLPCSVRRLSVDQLIAEDAALDKSCTDALSFVRTCEQLRGYNKQVQPNTVSTGLVRS